MTDERTRFEDEDNMLAAEYVLGVLSQKERDAFQQRLTRDPQLATAVRHWETHFASLADGIAPVAPPRDALAQVEKRLFGVEEKPSLWNSLGLWRALAAAAVAGVVVLGGMNFYRQPQISEALVAQVAGDSKQVTLVAYYDSAKGELRLNRTEGTAATGRAFELWLIAGQDAPVSLGVLPANASSTVTVPAALRGKFKDGVLAVSDEPTGGSTTGAPTGAVLATGKLTVI